MFYLFAGDRYYPGIGLDDFVGYYRTKEDAVTAGEYQITTGERDWYVVIAKDESDMLDTVAEGHRRRT